MSICLLVPTRGRPDAALALAQTFDETVQHTTTSIAFLCDDDDPTLERYQLLLADRDVVVAPRLQKGMGPTLNREAVRRAEASTVVGFLGDDHRLRTPGWDHLIGHALLGRPGVAYGNDLIHGSNLPTAAFLSAALVRQLGYMVPPGLLHLYIDNFWLELGRATHLAYIAEVTIEHLHPIAAKAEWDEGYREVNSGQMQAHDFEEFRRYMREDWPTEKEKLVGSAAV